MTHLHYVVALEQHGYDEDQDGGRYPIQLHEVTCVFEDDRRNDDAIEVGQVWLDEHGDDVFPCPVCGERIPRVTPPPPIPGDHPPQAGPHAYVRLVIDLPIIAGGAAELAADFPVGKLVHLRERAEEMHYAAFVVMVEAHEIPWRRETDEAPDAAPRQCASCGSTLIFFDCVDGWCCRGCGRTDADE